MIGELILKLWVLSIFLIFFLQLANILGRFQWLTCPRKVIVGSHPIFLAQEFFFFHLVEHLKLYFCGFLGFINWLAWMWSWFIVQARIFHSAAVVTWMGKCLSRLLHTSTLCLMDPTSLKSLKLNLWNSFW